MGTTRAQRCWMTLAALCAAWPTVGWAAFVPEGALAIERFDGTVKDLATWEQRTLGGSSIVQDDAITFATGPNDSPEYTTRAARIPVGGFVRATIRVDNITGPRASGYLALTSNSSGTASPFLSDTYSLYLQFANDGAAAGRNQLGTGSGQGFPLNWTENAPAVLEITRLAPDSALFKVGNPDGAGFVSHTMTVPAYSDDLFITLTGGGEGTATFDDVTIPAGAVPEPGVAASIIALAAIMRRRRARTGSRKRFEL